MAYACTYSQTYTTVNDFFDRIITGILACGWTLYDDVSSTEKVFSTTGELTTHQPGYVRVYISTNVRFGIYQYWDNVSHTGSCRAYDSSTYNYLSFTVDNPLWIYGDKNYIVILSSYSTASQYRKVKGFGLIPNLFDSNLATLTSDSTASGSNITIEVDDTTDFYDRSYIVTHPDFGRYTVSVYEIVDSTHLKIASIPVILPTGTKIGSTPNTFGINITGSTDQHHPVCSTGMSGTTNATDAYAYVRRNMMAPANNDPNANTNRYALQPIVYEEAVTTLDTPVGYGPTDDILRSAKSLANTTYQQDIYTTGSWEVLTATEDSGADDVRDSTKSWTTDEHKDKQLVCISGAAIGQTRIIESNTSDTLTVYVDWFVEPALDDIFRIIDGNVYRNIAYFAVKEFVNAEVTS